MSRLSRFSQRALTASLLLVMASGAALANTVTIVWNTDPPGGGDLGIGAPAGDAAGNTLLGYYCVPTCLLEGTTENAGLATGFGLSPSSEGDTATAFNTVLDPDGTFTAADVLRYNLVDGVDDKEDFTFDIYTLYFSLKVGSITAFFQNTSGGALQIHYTQSTATGNKGQGLSHYDQIGDRFSEVLPPSEVPLPAALPLLGSALAGAGLLGWRKRRKAA
ncbi:MAG: VPLPA-CTERM sorting domain-containing protein [Bauldia sp.]